MNYLIKNKITSSILLSSIIILLGFSLNAEVVDFNSTDTRINIYEGNFKLVKPSGKVFVNRILGNCEISSGAGSIHLGVVEGDCIVTTEAGDIEIKEVTGAVKVSTKSGNIHIKKADNFVTAETHIGEIVIDSAKFVHAKNITGGDVKIFNLTGHANIFSVGNILIMLDREFIGSEICDLSSQLGDITIYIPENIGANITIKTPITMNPKRRTSIESDFLFERFDQRCGPNEQFFYMTTVINNGGRKINLYIEKGNIFIRKLPSTNFKKTFDEEMEENLF